MKTEIKVLLAIVSLFAVAFIGTSMAEMSDAVSDKEVQITEEEDVAWASSHYLYPLLKKEYQTVFEATWKGYSDNENGGYTDLYSIQDVSGMAFRLVDENGDEISKYVVKQLDIVMIDNEKMMESNIAEGYPDSAGRYAFPDAVTFSVTLTDESGKTTYNAPNLKAPFVVTKTLITEVMKIKSYTFDGNVKTFDFSLTSDAKGKITKDDVENGIIEKTKENKISVTSSDVAGTYTVYLTINDNDYYFANETPVTWKINKKNITDQHLEILPLMDYDISIEISQITYSHQPSEKDVRMYYTYNVKDPATQPNDNVNPVIYDSKYGGFTLKVVSSDANGGTVEITGTKNFTGKRLVDFVIVPVNLEELGLTVHVDTIYTSGALQSSMFNDASVFLFPIDAMGYPEFCRDNYLITVMNARGSTIIDEANGIISGTTASEWNYIEITGINGFEGTLAGEFYVDSNASSAVIPTPVVVYEIGSEIIEDGIVYTVTSLDNKAASVTGYNAEIDAAVAIPDVVDGFKVTKIGTKAFYGCKTITSVDLGENIVSVGVKAFANCTKLSAVVFDDALKTVSAYAFYNCGKLTDVDFSDSVKTIGSYAFYKCNALKSVSFDSALKTVGTKAFTVTFEDANGKTLKQTAKVLAGKTFEGSSGVLKLVA